MVCTYLYDTWGNYDGAFGNNTLANLNPFRYRGYYYDNETGYYYLNSRYYNAEWGRFLNCDSTLLGNVGIMLHNTFSYASNNPVMFVDPSGQLVMLIKISYSPNEIIMEYDDGNYTMTNLTTGKEYDSEVVKKGEKSTRSTDLINMYEKGKENYKEKMINVEFDPENTKNGILDPNIKIYDSGIITNKIHQEIIIDAILCSPLYDQDTYGRTKESMLYEWDIQNNLYRHGIMQDHTKDCDFDLLDEGKDYIDFFFDRLF